MINVEGMELRTTDCTITRDQDGTHHIRIQGVGRDAIEFKLDLHPFLTVKTQLTEHPEYVNSSGGTARYEFELTLQGVVKPSPNGDCWHLQILNTDDCGRPKS